MKCNELETYLADYLEGELSPEAEAEMTRHLEECAPCRTEFLAYQRQDVQLGRYFKLQYEKVAQEPNPVAEELAPERSHLARFGRFYWAAAALVMLTLGLGTYSVYRTVVPTGHAALAQVAELQGRVMLLEGGHYRPIEKGAPLEQSQRIKVAEGGYVALKFRDGNILEAREGTQLALLDFPDRFEVAMNRGQVWAHLNIKPKKRFIVKTAHVRAIAVGTVYGVEEGLDRSIVSVARGTVQVESGAGQAAQAVTAGQTVSSRPDTETPAADKAIAWSHYQDDLASLAPKTDTQVAQADPQLQVEPSVTPAPAAASASQPAASQMAMASAPPAVSNLLDLLPEGTRYFLDFPDWGTILQAFHGTDYSALATEPSMRRWWEAIHGKQYLSEIEKEIRIFEILDIAKLIDGQLILAVVPPKDEVILMAGCQGHEAEIRARIDKLYMEQPAQTTGTLTLAQQQAQLAASQARQKEWEKLRQHAQVVQGRLIISSSIELAQETASRLNSGQPTGFTSSPFYKKLMSNVNNPKLMMAANLDGVFPEQSKNDPELDHTLSLLGVRGLDYMLVAPSFQGRGINQAARLGFKKDRFGMMNWLAEPAPMRGFDFFSADVHFFVSAIVRNPRQIFFDVLLYKYASGQHADEQVLRAFFDKHQSFFDSFGGEVALGADNPVLPVPNFKLAVEVADPKTFEAQLNQMVQELIASLEARDKFAYTDVKDYKGYHVHSLSIDEVPLTPSWALVDDFCIFGPGPQFVQDSIDVYLGQRSIGHDTHLLSLLPKTAQTEFSLLVYQDIAKSIPGLLKNTLIPKLGAEAGMMPDLGFLERYRAPGIAYAYAMPSYIDFHLNTPSGIDFNMGMAVPMVANWLAPLTNIGKTIDKVAEATVGLEKLEAAAEKFQKQNGRMPESLAELAHPVGQYISELPTDPFAPNGTDKLHLIPGAKPDEIILYSIGPDGVDSQGQIQLDQDKDINGPGDIVLTVPRK